jgi:hypothetical protein
VGIGADAHVDNVVLSGIPDDRRDAFQFHRQIDTAPHARGAAAEHLMT